MRHHVAHHQLNRTTAHREALMKNLAVALFRHERIKTTLPKARALRPYAERLITLAKRGDLHARRLAARHVRDHEILQKLFSELGERFRTRPGGYTRILKLGIRRGDNADLSLIELVDAKVRPVAKDAGTTIPSKSTKAGATPPDGAAAGADEAKKAAPKKAAPKKAEKAEKTPKKAAPKKTEKTEKAEKAPKKAAAKAEKPAKKADKKDSTGSKKASKPAKT